MNVRVLTLAMVALATTAFSQTLPAPDPNPVAYCGTPGAASLTVCDPAAASENNTHVNLDVAAPYSAANFATGNANQHRRNTQGSWFLRPGSLKGSGILVMGLSRKP